MRITTSLAALAVAASAVAVAPSPAQAAGTTPANEAVAAGSWLGGVINPTDGLLTGAGVDAPFGGYSTNLDFGISLAQSGQVPSAAFSKIRAGIDATVADFLGDIDDPANAGKVAKAVYYYDITGGNAASAGDDHLDLAAALADDVDDTTGRLGAAPGNVYSQVWGVLALKAIGSDEADRARDFLLTEKGYTASDAWGYDGDGDSATTADWTDDPDATSWAVSALAPWRGTAAVDTAIAAGVAYLKSAQVQGGIDLGWGSGPNANSTGLAAVALRAAGDNGAAAAATSWIKAHQLTSGPDAGAIAYDDQALSGVTAAGIDDAVLSQWVSATAQALPAFGPVPVATPVVVTPVPASQVRTRAKVVRSAHKGKVTITLTAAGKPFSGKVTIRIGKRKLTAHVTRGVAKVKAKRIFHGKKRVRATVAFAGSATVARFHKRVVFKARHR